MLIDHVYLAVVVCFALTLWFSRILMRYAAPLRLIETPSAHRVHGQPTPVVGGIAMALSMALVVAVSLPQYMPLFLVLGLLMLVGIADDISHLPSSIRLLLQALAVYLLIEVTGAKLTTLGFLYSDAPIALNAYAYPLTIFAGIGVINALNMSDGMDGLAGTLTVLCGLSLLLVGSSDSGLIALLVSALMGFLYFNARWFRTHAALFMGDAGSTTIGLLLTFLLINATQGTHATMAPVTALWLLALPLIDTVALLILRPLLGRSPFAADHLHYHHLLRDFGLSVNQTLAVVACVQGSLAVFGLTMAFNGVSESVQLSLFLFLFGAYLLASLVRARLT